MSRAPSFVYPFSLGDVFAPLLTNLPDGGQEIMDALAERDTFTEDALTFLPPQAGSTVITYATGGNTITYPRAFPHVPVPTPTLGDDVGAVSLRIKQIEASRTTTGFKFKLYDGAGEVAAGGTYRINWTATAATA